MICSAARECSDCYGADIIMRQYSRLKAAYKENFRLTFLSATDTETILHLITEFPEFLPIYKEISEFTLKPLRSLNSLHLSRSYGSN